MRTTLLKRIEGLELWAVVTGSAKSFAVKFAHRRLRVVDSLAGAEALLETKLAAVRAARAH